MFIITQDSTENKTIVKIWIKQGHIFYIIFFGYFWVGLGCSNSNHDFTITSMSLPLFIKMNEMIIMHYSCHGLLTRIQVFLFVSYQKLKYANIKQHQSQYWGGLKLK